jgi:hypothetical protein
VEVTHPFHNFPTIVRKEISWKTALADVDPRLQSEDMALGKVRPKISWSSRRIRLGVAHHGAPSTWTAPAKDRAPEPVKPNKKRS